MLRQEHREVVQLQARRTATRKKVVDVAGGGLTGASTGARVAHEI
jgi:hypothetical protein